MLRFYYSIIRNLIHLYMIPLMRYVAKHPQKYDEYTRYKLASRMVKLVTKASHAHARYHGLENIPTDGNYVLYPNHSGKFDFLALVKGHKNPISIVMDYERSHMLMANEIVDLVQGKRLKRDDVRQALTVMNEITEELKNGKKFIIFPEGGYLSNKGNKLYQFKPGAFKCVLKAKSTIVPVALVDCYKVYKYNSLRRVFFDVYFLKPITYDEFKDLKTQEIAELVRQRIAEQISESTGVPVDSIIEDIPDGTVLI